MSRPLRTEPVTSAQDAMECVMDHLGLHNIEQRLLVAPSRNMAGVWYVRYVDEVFAPTTWVVCGEGEVDLAYQQRVWPPM